MSNRRAMMFSLGGLPPVTLLTDLVASYSFNNNFNENMGLSPNGTGTDTSFVTGKINQAVRFNLVGAGSARVDIVDDDNFSFTTGSGNDVPFSISTWVYVSAFSTFGNWFINKRTATSGGDEWQLLAIPNGTIIFTKFDRTTNSITQQINSLSSAITTGAWYHIVITDDGSKTYAGMKIYINGSAVTTTDASSGTYTGMPNGTHSVSFGNASWSPSGNFLHNGYMDETNIYKNRVLTSTEVSALFADAEYPF